MGVMREYLFHKVVRILKELILVKFLRMMLATEQTFSKIVIRISTSSVTLDKRFTLSCIFIYKMDEITYLA